MCNVRTGARWPALGYDVFVAATETLRTVVDAGNASRRLDELSTARVILKIAEQVHGAQQKAGAGKAIGPLTPSSITIEPSGTVKLGLAEPSAFAYAAPEQLDGAEGDRRSDVWSLGVVMWEALTHSTLFEGGDDSAIKAAVRQQTIDPPATLNANIPYELSAICMRALSRTPGDRYQSAKVMAAEIEAVLDDAGYDDNDLTVREFIATMGQPKREPKLSAPPMTVTPAQGVGVTPVEMLTPPSTSPNQTAPGMVIPRGDEAPATKSVGQPITVQTRAATGTQPPKPSILDQEPTQPPSSMMAASAGTLAPKIEPPTVVSKPVSPKPVAIEPPKIEPPTAASIGLAATPISPTSFLKPPTESPPGLGPIPGLNAGANLASALASAGTAPAKPATDRSAFQTLQSASVPMAPVLPATVPAKPVLPKITPAATAHGFASGDHDISEAAKLAQAVQANHEKEDLADAGTPKPLLVAKAELPKPELPKPTLPKPVVAPKTEPKVEARKREPTPAPRKRAPTGNPDPAAVVALPGMKGGRESQEVLGGWGWGTDSHPAIKEYEADDDLPVEHSSRKTLIYVIGGGFGVVVIIIILAFAFGGSKAKPTKQAADTGSGSGSAEIAYGSAVAYGSATGDPTGGSSAVGSGSADTISSAAVATGSANAAMTGSGSAVATDNATGSAVATTGSGSATMPGTTTTAAIPNTPPPPVVVNTPPPVVVEKPKPVVPDKPKHPVVAEKPKPAPVPVPKHPVAHPPVAHPVVAEGPSPNAKADAEAAYRQGVQLFARGDSAGALSSLRVSLASNPSYAPTWRGLGLVFEKMGEKDQARSAFKRYLQLAPGAGDADQIRNRMERLGS